MRYIFTILAILLSACGRQTVIEYEADFSKQTQLTMFSITETGELCSSYGCFPTIYFKNKSTNQLYVVPDTSINSDNDGISIGFSGDYSHYDDLWGKVYFIQLPAGDYEIANWVVEYQAVPTGKIRHYNKKPLNLDFTVSSNAITYIGNINIEFYYSNIGGFNNLGGGKLTLNDNLDADIIAAKKKYKGFINKNIVNNISKKPLTSR